MSVANYILKTYTKPPIIAAFGNVLLDIQAIIHDKSIVNQFNLDNTFQKEIDEEEFVVLLKEAKDKCNTDMKCPGGSAQNTMRLFQWMVQFPGYTVMFGGIGTDENGKFLESAVSRDGVRTRYAYHQERKTGTCISFINGNRSLIAHIGAANYYSPSDLDIPENWEVLDNVLMVYVEGFFITHSFSTVVRLINFCNTNGTVLGMNLNAPYVCENHGENLLQLMLNADIIFGHESEFLALSKHVSCNVKTAIDVAILIQKQSLVSNKKIKKKDIPQLLQEGPIIVITAGRKPISVMQGHSHCSLEFSVPQLDRDHIKDTTGAGDAFVAGFLSAAFANMDLESCVRSGCWTSQQIIQQIGVFVPSYLPDIDF